MPSKAAIKRQVQVSKSFGREMLHLQKVDSILFSAALPHHQTVTDVTEHRRGYRRTDLFASLAGSIVSQQLSTKAADSIWQRLKSACDGAVTPDALLKLRTPTLRKAGLSAAKVKSLKELSKAIRTGELDLLALKHLPESVAVEKLSRIWGIGYWTAEMFLMFALRREDVFSSGDLALVRAIESLYGIPKDSKKEAYEAIASRWSPYRTFASRILWKTRDTSPKNI